VSAERFEREVLPSRLTISLPAATHAALMRLAISERRDTRDQAVVLIINALWRRGLVSHDGLGTPRPRRLPPDEDDNGEDDEGTPP
jgi:hypothetical protein